MGESIVVILFALAFFAAAGILALVDWRRKRKLDRLVAEAIAKNNGRQTLK